MLELPHTIVGATIATKIGNPSLCLPLAFLSHFVLDLLPHWNPHILQEMREKGQISWLSKKIILVDGLSALFLGTFLAIRFYPDLLKVATILAACFLAVLPDLAEAPYFFANFQSKRLTTYLQFHSRLQMKVSFWPGILTQIIVIAICLFILFL